MADKKQWLAVRFWPTAAATARQQKSSGRLSPLPSDTVFFKASLENTFSSVRISVATKSLILSVEQDLV
jgi:hypothetical protein